MGYHASTISVPSDCQKHRNFIKEANSEKSPLELLRLTSTAPPNGRYLKKSKNIGQALRIAIPKESLVTIGINNSDAGSSIKAFTDESGTGTHP
jgi:hypothetical protein